VLSEYVTHDNGETIRRDAYRVGISIGRSPCGRPDISESCTVREGMIKMPGRYNLRSGNIPKLGECVNCGKGDRSLRRWSRNRVAHPREESDECRVGLSHQKPVVGT
jgi:hypothetical protein